MHGLVEISDDRGDVIKRRLPTNTQSDRSKRHLAGDARIKEDMRSPACKTEMLLGLNLVQLNKLTQSNAASFLFWSACIQVRSILTATF